LCENSHHRKTSTLTPTPTRRPRSHHSYTLICEEPHFTIQELLKGERPNVPPMYAPYIEAKKQRPTHDQSGLF